MPFGWGRGGCCFLFPGGRRIVRAVILNRAKFAEWLRTPQRGSGEWPHLYSDKNQTGPMLMLAPPSQRSSSPAYLFTT